MYCSAARNKTDIEDSCVSHLILKDRQVMCGNPIKFEGFVIANITLDQFSKQLSKRIEDRLVKCGRHVKIKINIYKNIIQSTYALEIYAIQDYLTDTIPPVELLMPVCISKFERAFYSLETIVDKKREMLLKN